MTPLTSAEKMRAYRANILPLMAYLGFFGRNGVSPSISAFETRLAHAWAAGEKVEIRIGGETYPAPRLTAEKIAGNMADFHERHGLPQPAPDAVSE